MLSMIGLLGGLALLMILTMRGESPDRSPVDGVPRCLAKWNGNFPSACERGGR